TDSATLTLGTSPTGTITFTLTGPSGFTTVTRTATVNGNNTYSSGTAVTATLAGTYTWSAVYNGDSNNASAQANVPPSPPSPETTTVTPGTVTVDTTILDSGGGAVSHNLGESVKDSSTVTPPVSTAPTGTVTYEFFHNGSGTGTPFS